MIFKNGDCNRRIYGFLDDQINALPLKPSQLYEWYESKFTKATFARDAVIFE